MTRPFWLIAAPIVVAASANPSAAQQNDAQARENLSAFEACARITDDDERHRCLDAALRTTGMIDAEAEQARDRANYGRSPAARAEPAPVMERSASAQQPAAAARPSDPGRQSLQTTIASARRIGQHALQVTTADAGDWVSTEMQRFRRTPAAGDAFEIIPAALGSFRCRLESSTLYPCRRVD